MYSLLYCPFDPWLFSSLLYSILFYSALSFSISPNMRKFEPQFESAMLVDWFWLLLEGNSRRISAVVPLYVLYLYIYI